MLIIAHRGYSSRHPENSALAFEKAIDAGADFIETDLRFSLDGTIVCYHDPDLKRIAGRADAIENLKAQDLKKVSLLNGQSILSLQDVLEIAVQAERRVQVMFDVKVPTDAMLDTALPLVEKMRMSTDIMYGARTVDHAESFKKRASKISILGMPKKTSLIPDFIKAGVTAIRVWEEDITPEIVSMVKAVGVPVWITAGLRRQGEAAGDITRDRIEALDNLGVDAVLVNDPALVRQVIEGGNQNSQLAVGASA